VRAGPVPGARRLLRLTPGQATGLCHPA
jgi:hypothetical protein